jgi:hypothetical protein
MLKKIFFSGWLILKNVIAIDKEMSTKINEAPAFAGALDYERSC